MASMVTDLAKTYVEKLINGAISESRFVCCLASITEEYEEEKVRLEVERTTMRQRAKIAIRRGHDIQDNVLRWEEDVDKLIGEEDNAETKQKCFRGICPDCIWRYKRGRELANKTELIKRMVERGEKLENVGLPSSLPGVERYSSQHYISFKSRVSTYKELLDALKDDCNYIIGLQGMGGTGKTTLAKEVGKELKQSEQFSQVTDTTVSFTPDIKKIQDDIAGPLGLKWGENCNDSDRPKKLWSRLTNGEKILVILDDVWDRDPPLDFDAIGIPKQDNHKGCRVLVTTRSKWIFNNMDCDKVIELDLLSEKEAWFMFKRFSGISTNGASKSLIEKGRKIANECKRLPVAIAVIASSLKGQQHRLHEWNATLKSLKKPVSMHGVDEDVVGIYKCLKSSYDNMRDEKAKGLFLLCSLYREDEDISVEVLTRLGIGAGLFGEDYGSYDDARNQVVVAKNKLLDSCLLLKAGKRYVKMHDLVRDAAPWMKKEEIRAVHLSHKVPNLLVEKESNTTTKCMLCEGKAMDVFYSRFGGSNLEILIANFDKDVDRDYVQVEVSNSMFENIVRLRALHIQNECNSDDPVALSLPQAIQSLANIRSLLVDRVDLGDISVLGNVESLETLDLVNCAINELPLELTKLKKFKLLKLGRCKIRRNNPFQVIAGCSSLEELYFDDSFNSFCQEIIFPKLQRYHIYSEAWDTLYERSKCVAFNGDGDVGFFSDTTFKYCMQTVEVLHLRSIKWVWRNLIPEIVPIDQGMNDLAELHLCGISQLQCLIDANDSNVPNVMSKLVVLKLIEMQNLKELFRGPISFDSLKSLEKLKIEDCNYLQSLFKYKQNLCNLKIVKLVKCSMLVSLFQLSTSRSLVMLEELSIIDCEQLESIIIIDDESREDELKEAVVDGDNDNKSHGSMFQKLTLLSIDGCPVLECIFPFLPAPDLLVLETINIRKCDGLKYIFGQDVELGSLKEISLEELTNFIDIFPKSYLPMSSSMKGLSSTSKDCSKASTQSDPTKCNSFSWAHICCYSDKNKHKLRTNTSAKLSFVSQDLLHDYSIASGPNSCHLPIQPHILCNIKVILLSHFSKIKSVFSLALAQRMLLESLTVKNYDGLKNIIVDTKEDNGQKNWGNVFPKLKELHVENCVQLEYIFGHHTLDHQNNNEIDLHLPLLKSLELCELPSLVAVCPKIYRATFPPLAELKLVECSQFDIKSIGDLICHSIPKSMDTTTIKELSKNVEYFCALERLNIKNNQVENIFCLNEINGVQQVNLEIQKIELHGLPIMTYLFIGPKNYFTLQNLVKINIVQCEKLETIFSTSITRCLPMLLDLRIEECKELKHIIEDDDDDEKQKMTNFHSPRTYFPKLKVLVVLKCNKLKCVFPAFICKTLPELKFLIIREADELEEIFKSEGDHKVLIPNLRVVSFVNLPSVCQGIQFQAVENRFVQNCQKLCVTSTPAQTSLNYVLNNFDTDWEYYMQLRSLFQQSQENTKEQDTNTEIPSSDTINNIASGVEVGAISEHKLTSSQSLKESKDKSIQESTAPAPEKTNSETRNEPPIQLVTPTQKDIKRNHEEEITLGNASSGLSVTCNHITSSQDDGDDQIAMPSSSTTMEDVQDRGSEKISETHDQGNPSQIMEDLNSHSLLKLELEQLVLKKHLESKNLSLLIDFLVKHPSNRLTDTSLSNRYKGYAYTCLVELLKFLQTHSVLDVLGSNHSEFVELLQDVRRCAFDKAWLDGVERRALFTSLQFSQDQDAVLQNLLESKRS